MASMTHLPRGVVLTALAMALALAFGIGPANVATAAAIPEIRGPITDETGVLSDGEDQIQAAIDRLLDERNIQLWVVFTNTAGGLSGPEFASGIAAGNGLGGNDALLYVALEDRLDAIWLPDGREDITDAELDEVIGRQLEPRLADGDFVGAVVAAADGLRAAAAPVEEEPAAPGGGVSGPGGDTGSGGGFLGILLLGGGILLVVWWFRSRRARQREAEERDRRTGRLAREANALLIATDERVRDAHQEIGFVEAEYGEAELAPLREAVSRAREELGVAFAVRQRLDDGEPETPQEREAMLSEIVERSRRAQAALDAEAARLKALRDFERDAPQILERMNDRIESVGARLPTAQAAFDGLAAFSPATRAPAVGHIEEARKGLDGARAATERGRTALAAGDRRKAAREARTAEQGISGATALLDAVEKLAASAREAQGRIPAELREAETDLAAARAAAREVGTGDASGRIAAAETALRQARASADTVPLDPIGTLRAATEAHRAADEALAAVRHDAEQRERLLVAVENSLATAQTDIDLAADFIATRRGSVGRRARTRLAEADRLFQTAVALSDQDPQRALDAARRAERLAEEAYDLAAEDFDQFTGGSGVIIGGGGADIAGAILGGVLGGVLSGGGRGGGWGGSPWGSSGPFGGGGGWGGPFGGGGGWGGGGFGGGGFGGGGRARGGRW